MARSPLGSFGGSQRLDKMVQRMATDALKGKTLCFVGLETNFLNP